MIRTNRFKVFGMSWPRVTLPQIKHWVIWTVSKIWWVVYVDLSDWSTHSASFLFYNGCHVYLGCKMKLFPMLKCCTGPFRIFSWGVWGGYWEFRAVNAWQSPFWSIVRRSGGMRTKMPISRALAHKRLSLAFTWEEIEKRAYLSHLIKLWKSFIAMYFVFWVYGVYFEA